MHISPGNDLLRLDAEGRSDVAGDHSDAAEMTRSSIKFNKGDCDSTTTGVVCKVGNGSTNGVSFA